MENKIQTNNKVKSQSISQQKSSVSSTNTTKTTIQPSTKQQINQQKSATTTNQTFNLTSKNLKQEIKQPIAKSGTNNEKQPTKIVAKTATSVQQNNKKSSDQVQNSSVNKRELEIQKTKNAIELIGIFKKLEKNLVDVLQALPENIEEEGNILANIKAYNKKVELARKIFDEYENTSNLITNLIESQKNDIESIEISKKVIEPTDKEQKSKINEKDLLKQVQAMEKQSKGLDKIEIEAVGDTVIVKKKPILGRELELKKN